MKLFKRYFLVVCLSVLLLLAFSTIVSADESILQNTKIEISTNIKQNDIIIPNQSLTNSNITIYPTNTTIEKAQSSFNLPKGFSYTLNQSWLLTSEKGDTLFRANKKYNVVLENGYYNIGYEVISESTGNQVSATYIVPKYNRVLATYYDGKQEYFEFSTGNKIGRPTTLYLEFTPSKDVVSLEFILGSSKIDLTDTNYFYNGWIHTGEQNGTNSFKVTVDTESVEAGLLSGIIGWIKSIYDSIVNLPSKIWEFISEGLKSLFIPSEEALDEFKSKLDTLLEEKLGAIYQVVNILLEGWDSISSNDVTNTIDFPEVTIPLPDDNSFSFGGQVVRIVPDGFEFLATAIKLITGISCTVLFVNGLKKRYDEIMGG